MCLECTLLGLSRNSMLARCRQPPIAGHRRSIRLLSPRSEGLLRMLQRPWLPWYRLQPRSEGPLQIMGCKRCLFLYANFCGKREMRSKLAFEQMNTAVLFRVTVTSVALSQCTLVAQFPRILPRDAAPKSFTHAHKHARTHTFSHLHTYICQDTTGIPAASLWPCSGSATVPQMKTPPLRGHRLGRPTLSGVGGIAELRENSERT